MYKVSLNVCFTRRYLPSALDEDLCPSRLMTKVEVFEKNSSNIFAR